MILYHLGLRSYTKTTFNDGSSIKQFRSTIGVNKIEVRYVLSGSLHILFHLILNKIHQPGRIFYFFWRKHTSTCFLGTLNINLHYFCIIFKLFHLICHIFFIGYIVHHQFYVEALSCKYSWFLVIFWWN